MTHAVLDLFCGTGFGVALQQMGVKEFGVDKMPEVHATRDMNGMETIYSDVWDIHLAEGLAFDTLLGGPPCPSFSAAGNGSGRKQMPLILEAIEEGLWRDIADLRAWVDTLEDERTGLALIPLAYVDRYRPDYVLLEQVPPVLPIWQAYETQLQRMGYSTWAGILRSEQYGVPQTRKRAILMARKAHLGPVKPPTPTHSRYYERDPLRLDEGVLPWVSMAEALTDRPTDRIVHHRQSPAVAR